MAHILRRFAGATALALACPQLSTAAEAPAIEEGRSFWSFRPITDPTPPAVSDAAWPANAIDHFSLARRERTGQATPAVADRRTLVRRLYIDLHGLPPSPQEIDSFLADTSPDAYSKLVDRLLASRRFAERWARHWLDIVRYADSTGGGRAMLLPEAWRYRDYVVESFANDKPFKRFVAEQVAGDLLDPSEPKEKSDAIVGTGFLALGPSNYELQDKERLRMDVVDEQIDTLGRAFMGMTLGCARCHDHFFDPIPTTDYYALAGIFRSTKTLEHANVSKWINTTLPAIDSDSEHQALTFRQWKERVGTIKTEIAELKKLTNPASRINEPVLAGFVVDDDEAVFEGSWTISQAVKGFYGARYMHDSASPEPRSASYSRKLPESGIYEIHATFPHDGNRAPAAEFKVHHADGETVKIVDQRQAAGPSGYAVIGRFRFDGETPALVTLRNSKPGNGTVIADAIAFVPIDALDEQPAPDPPLAAKIEVAKEKTKQLESELKTLEKKRPPPLPFAMSVIDEKEPADYAVNLGGNPHDLGRPVARGFLSVIGIPGDAPHQIAKGQSGRLELANWLTSPEHPLVARVYANRAWRWLTGTGIVPTPDNFGATGEPPSDPALLDHLASHFLANGGSTKSLVRHIVLSKTYRMSRTGAPRRLDAESLRDAMLAVSGELDLTVTGGPAIKKGTSSEFGYRFDSANRSLYIPIFRNHLPELFEVFDFPDPSLSRGNRSSTTLATQALYLMNHPWVIDRSKAAAKRWIASSADTETAITRAYLETLARPPDDEELALAVAYLGREPDEKSWTAFQQTLFATLDFRHY